MSLKNINLFILIISLFSAQTTFNEVATLKSSGTVVVTIRGQEIMSNSETGKKIQTELQSEQEKLAKPLQADEEKIRAKESKLIENKTALDKDLEEYEKSSKLLSTEAKQSKMEKLQERAHGIEEEKSELDRMVKKLQAQAKQLEAKMGQIYQTKMTKFDALIKEVIKDLSIKNGWDIVLMEESVVCASEKTSKTKEVINELDKRAKADVLKKKEALQKEASKEKSSDKIKS